jgi:hypothetical protein
MPDELTEVLIDMKESDRDTKRQLGELDKTTGVQVKKSATLKCVRKELVIKDRDITGDIGIWGNTLTGVWGTFKWGESIDSEFKTIRLLSYPELINKNALLYLMVDNGKVAAIKDYSENGNDGVVS